LRKQLEKRTIEETTSQSRGENENCLKRQLKEAQDIIIQLHEEKRMSKQRVTDHFKECGSTMDNVRATLTNAQVKMKGNVVLWRQVKNLNRRNWSLRKTLRVLRLQERPEA
jgi:hypothetical protein